MTSEQNFQWLANKLLDKGMGTENVADLLYALVKMNRPLTSVAVGLGYSTLYLLKALAENEQEQLYDDSVVRGVEKDPARQEVLLEEYFNEQRDNNVAPMLYGIDNFSEQGNHLDNLEKCIELSGFKKFFKLHQVNYQDFNTSLIETEIDFVWLDCGHQLDYPELINLFWPLLNPDGGMMAIHYTYVDIEYSDQGKQEKLMIAGAVANAIKKQQLRSGMMSQFEFITLLEPHKYRQGSVSLIRRIDSAEVCRDTHLQDEHLSLYGNKGIDLIDLNNN